MPKKRKPGQTRVEGINKLEKKFAFVISKVPETENKAERNGAKIIWRQMRKLVPIDTGQLRKSIRIFKTKDKRIGIGPHTHYAWFVEFGTVKMAAQPYVRPAFDKSRKRVKKLFGVEISKDLNNHIAGG